MITRVSAPRKCIHKFAGLLFIQINNRWNGYCACESHSHHPNDGAHVAPHTHTHTQKKSSSTISPIVRYVCNRKNLWDVNMNVINSYDDYDTFVRVTGEKTHTRTKPCVCMHVVIHVTWIYRKSAFPTKPPSPHSISTFYEQHIRWASL